MPLDSDSPNADAQLHVEFYTYDKDGEYKDKPFVRIMVPGDKTNVIDQPARDDHKRRFQRQWLTFQMENSGAQVIGIPLSDWHRERPEELTDGQLQELIILKFMSVEQLARASDAQVAKVGMGAAGLRERARVYLGSRNSQIAGAEMQKQKSEIEELKAMVAQLSALATMRAAEPLKAARPAKGKRGGWNKGKKKVPVNVQHNDAPASAAGGQ